MRADLIVVMLIMGINACASPCDGMMQSISDGYRTELSSAISVQLDKKTVQTLLVFHDNSWSIVKISTEDTDDGYLFYTGDPRSNKSVAIWSGWAMKNEQRSIKDWTIKNAPGIPPRLAECFAWHVTGG